MAFEDLRVIFIYHLIFLIDYCIPVGFVVFFQR